MNATKYITFDAFGVATGTGFTPDGTLPTDSIECTEKQVLIWEQARLVDGELVISALVSPVVTVPVQVTMRQARLALFAAGKLAEVDSVIAQLPSPQKENSQIEWDHSSTVDRRSNLTEMIGAALSFDAAALDALFIQAAAL